MVKRFIINLLIFISPPILVLAIPFFVLFKSGEYTNLNAIIKKQGSGDKKYFFGLAYTDPSRYYKYQLFLKKEPEIIALGSSRVLQFRDSFFKSPSSFYNMGGTIQHLNTLEKFVDLIPAQHHLKVIILSIDQNWLNLNLLEGFGQREGDFDKYNYPIGSFLPNSWDVYKDIFAGKISLSKLMVNNTNDGYGYFGVAAVMRKAGNRNDGSRYFGEGENQQPYSTRFQLFIDRVVKTHDEQFKSGDSLEYKSCLQQFSRILGKCRAKGIYVSAYLAPLANCLTEELQKDSVHYAYMRHLGDYLKPVFSTYNYPLQDYTELKSLSMNDSEMLDALHCSEKMSLRIWLDLGKKDPDLLQYADIPFLKKSLDENKYKFEVFGY